MIDKLWNLLVNAKHKIQGLFIGYVIIFFVVILPCDNFFEKFIANLYIRALIYLLFFATWTLIWSIWKNHLPKSPNDKIGIVISLTYENAKQREGIDDLVLRLNNIIESNQLFDLINIITLNNHQATLLNTKIKNYYRARKQKKNCPRWKEINKRLNSQLYLYGSVKVRDDVEKKFILNLDSVVFHKEIDSQASTKLSQEMRNLLPKEISFYEKISWRLFNLTGDHLAVFCKYTIGTAAFLSGDPVTAFDLHKNVSTELTPFRNLPNIRNINNSLKTLLTEELHILARKEIIKDIPDYDKAIVLLNEALKINKNNYNVYLLLAYISIVYEDNPHKSLNYNNKAKKIASNVKKDKNYTWLYNEAFLHMYIGNFEKGLKCYQKTISKSFSNDDDIINQCITFNKNRYDLNNKLIQCLFITGFLYYKKLGNMPAAYEYFDKFLDEADGNNEYRPLTVRAKTYFSEIKHNMGILDK